MGRAARRIMTANLAALLLVAASSCNRQPPETYAPGLGEIMTLQQMRHSKLFFAGQANNWELAAYELKELQEGFDDVVKFHPTHENVPEPLSALVPSMIDGPLKELDDIITAKDRGRFFTGFDELTKACNGCHQAANFGFNVVERPSQNPFTNQAFQPRGPQQ
jgi:hypothetical protein